jgi:hypothetical protein
VIGIIGTEEQEQLSLVEYACQLAEWLHDFILFIPKYGSVKKGGA